MSSFDFGGMMAGNCEIYMSERTSFLFSFKRNTGGVTLQQMHELHTREVTESTSLDMGSSKIVTRNDREIFLMEYSEKPPRVRRAVTEFGYIATCNPEAIITVQSVCGDAKMKGAARGLMREFESYLSAPSPSLLPGLIGKMRGAASMKGALTTEAGAVCAYQMLLIAPDESPKHAIEEVLRSIMLGVDEKANKNVLIATEDRDRHVYHDVHEQTEKGEVKLYKGIAIEQCSGAIVYAVEMSRKPLASTENKGYSLASSVCGHVAAITSVLVENTNQSKDVN